MDSDSFYPAFVTAARVLGLGEYAVKSLETFGLRMHEAISEEKGKKELVNSITWSDATKTIRERISAWKSGTGHFLSLSALSPGRNAEIEIVATEIAANIWAFAGEQFAKIIDAEGRSTFLQVTEGKHKTQYGYGTVTFPGGTSETNVKKIPHELGAVPNNVQLTNAPPGPWCVGRVLNAEKTFIEVQFAERRLIAPAAGTEVGFFYEISI